MRIRLRPIDWLEGYKELQAAAMVKSGIQRTLFCYGLIRGQGNIAEKLGLNQ